MPLRYPVCERGPILAGVQRATLATLCAQNDYDGIVRFTGRLAARACRKAKQEAKDAQRKFEKLQRDSLRSHRLEVAVNGRRFVGKAAGLGGSNEGYVRGSRSPQSCRALWAFRLSLR